MIVMYFFNFGINCGEMIFYTRRHRPDCWTVNRL